MANPVVGRHTWRLRLLAAGLVLVAVGLTARLFQLQVLSHEAYVAEAESTHQGYRTVYAPRGAILDRNGHPLALSVDTFDIYADRRAWRDEDRARTAAAALSPILGVPAGQIIETVAPGRGDQLLVKALDFERGRAIELETVPGIRVVPTSRREYPEGNLGAALIGYIGKDPVGLSGIEADFDDILAGKPGSALFDRDSLGNQIVIGGREVRQPTPGTSVVLTIDRNLQRLVETALDEAVAQHRATGGDIIIQDPSTGAILAMATRPSFDLLNPDVSKPSQLQQFRNRSVSDQYEPGSVFKLVTMSAAIDARVVNPDTTYNDLGLLRIDDSEIRNWDERGYGTQTMTQVLQHSLNTGAAWVAQKLGAPSFYQYVAAFGFGEPTGVGLAGEASGAYRTPDRDDWARVDLATNSFGQGISVTPLQVITAISAIANGGNLMRPYVVQELAGAGTHEVTESEVVRRVMSEEASRTMRSMMNAVVEGIPGHGAQVPNYHVGGKTGTANRSSDGYTVRTIASFIGLAPVDRPRFVMLVKIDDPQDSEFGSVVAAPIFGKLAPQILRYLKVPSTDALNELAETDDLAAPAASPETGLPRVRPGAEGEGRLP